MVIYKGPFILGAGKSRTHVLDMPQYVGSVRTMVIATNGKGGYGRTDNATPVKQDLMVQGTLPRVAGPNETFSFPVTLFTAENSSEKVTLNLKTTGDVAVEGSSQIQVVPKKEGETTVAYTLKTGASYKPVNISLTATSGVNSTSWETDLTIREPNRSRNSVEKIIIKKGESQHIPVKYFGRPGTNTALMEVSSMPPINLEQRVRWLIRYPHGCIEQTTSSVFPQLYLSDLKDLSSQQKADIQKNVDRGIKRLSTFQLPSGGLSYWPGGHTEDDWGTTYAGHFLLEAKNKGYHVPQDILDKWTKWQKEKANRWSGKDALNQAYRLYTLSLAGEGLTGPMNRLKEQSNLSKQAQWRLAAAYALDGKSRAAEAMVDKLDWSIPTYRSTSKSYGSSLRDKAMILETLTLVGKKEKAFSLLKEISLKLSSDTYYSTQTLSYCLIGVGQFAGTSKNGNALKMSYKLGTGVEQSVESDSYSISVDLAEQQNTLDITNTLRRTPILNSIHKRSSLGRGRAGRGKKSQSGSRVPNT